MKNYQRYALIGSGLLMLGLPLVAGESWLMGVTRPYRETTLSTAVPGIVSALPLSEGAVVRAGAVLVELHKEQEVLELQRRTLLYENQSDLEAAAARLATSASEYQSTQKVYEATRSVSREELDRKKLEYDLAQAERMLAEMNKQREGLEMAMAAEALDRRSVRSPIDGVVAAILIEVGEGCEVRQPLIVVVDTSQVIFQSNLDATQLARLVEGQQVTLEIEHGEVYVAREGTVTFVSPVVDRASGLGTLKVQFDNKEEPVWAGVGGRIRIPGGVELSSNE